MSSHVVREIHRYPVKSMLGERLGSVAVEARGLVGDRRWAVRDASGKFACGKNSTRFRRHDPVFEWAARLGDGGPLDAPTVLAPDGRSFTAGDPALAGPLRERFGEPVELVVEGDTTSVDGSVVPHFDAGAVSIVGTASLAALAGMVGDPGAVDPRRFRVNLVVETDEPFVEESWVGRSLSVGSVRLRVTQRISRCRVVDVRQGDVPQDGRLLKTLGAQRDTCLAVYADVVRAGQVAVGAAVTVG